MKTTFSILSLLLGFLFLPHFAAAQDTAEPDTLIDLGEVLITGSK